MDMEKTDHLYPAPPSYEDSQVNAYPQVQPNAPPIQQQPEKDQHHPKQPIPQQQSTQPIPHQQYHQQPVQPMPQQHQQQTTQPMPQQHQQYHQQPVQPMPQQHVQQQPLPNQHMYVPTGTSRPPVTFLATGLVGPHPTSTTCPTCQVMITSKIRYHSTTKTHLMALMLCIFCCWPCVCIPYCVDSCRSANHFCPKCNTFLGTYSFS